MINIKQLISNIIHGNDILATIENTKAVRKTSFQQNFIDLEQKSIYEQYILFMKELKTIFKLTQEE